MVGQFTAREEVTAYLAGDRIQCLDSERWFEFLPPHLRSHGTNAADYRDRWGIPAGAALAGVEWREAAAARALALRVAGVIGSPEHLARATEAARTAARPTHRVTAAVEPVRLALRRVRPWDATLLPPGSVTANGRDADRVREYQRAYRARGAGNPEPMRLYRLKMQPSSRGEK